MRYRPLGTTGIELSELGFGASPFGGVFGAVSETASTRAVHAALAAGINYFDVAPYYGLTLAETRLGQALAGVPRDSYVLSTKIGRYDVATFDFSVHRIEQSLHESLQRLGTDYLDILLCHDIEFGDPQQIINETLPALQRLKQQGDTRAIGISGLPLNVLRSTTQHTAVDVVLSYCHYTLSDTTLTHCLPTWLAQNIGVINASPLGMGLFSENPLPAWHPAPPALQQAAQAAQLLCQNTQTPLSQIALQFALQAPGIATTLIGMASEQQVIANVAALNTAVDHVLLAQLQQHFAPVKDVTWPSGLSVWS